MPGPYIVSMSMSVADLCIAHIRKASNALCTLIEREKKSFSRPGENGQRNMTDLAGSLVTGVRTYKRGTVNRGTVKRGQLIAGQLIARTNNRADT